MQNYSYFLIPLFPYSPAYTQPMQQQPLTLPFTFTVPPMVAPAPFIQQQPIAIPANPLIPLARGHQQVSNQEAPIPSPPYPLSRNQSIQISRTSREQSLVLDHNVYKYPKKNAESNLINQIFSYISIPSKSKKAVLQLTEGDELKVNQFYEIMRTLKRQNKKYINRNYLKEFLLMEKSHIIHGILQKIKIETNISKKQLQQLLRALVISFLRENCVLTILTSSKLDRYAIKEHLARRRDVLQHLLYHMKMGVEAE